MLYDILQEKRDLILKVAKIHGINNVRVFGSVARLEDKPNSDLDLLVDFDTGRSLFDLIRFKQEIEDLLNVNVDVVTENSIHWTMKEDVLDGAKQLRKMTNST
ncbi:nucleotidyltransferase family protein [Bacillus pinisoli]|uniref:nucleotidyltransferase family protein n=1 Tax=Bacillus pinisoli TaxID=2901866 RepID=UPI001FF2EDB5